jgi:hypothetical protein
MPPRGRFGMAWEIIASSRGSGQRRSDGELIDWSYWTLDSPVLARVRLLGSRTTMTTVVTAGLAPVLRVTDLDEVRYAHGLRHLFFGPPSSPLLKTRTTMILVRVALN